MNEYKQWSDSELILNGQRLRQLIDQAYNFIRKQPQKTNEEISQHMNFISAIDKAEKVIEVLRQEYKLRKNIQ